MKKAKGKFGYVFKLWVAQVGKLQGVYFIQVRGVLFNQWFTVYRSKQKPQFRHLGALCLLCPIYGLYQILIVTWFIIFGLGIAFPLKVIGCIFCAASQAFVFDFKNAKRELWRLFT